jgi:sporulation integral membrane protein YtvI
MDTMNKVSLKKLGIFGLVIISVVGGVFLSVKLAFFLMPFLIAFALSSLMEPLIRVLDSKLRIKRKFSAPIILLLLLAIIVTLVVLGVLRLIEEIKWLIASAPGFFSNLYTKISELMIKGEEYIEWLPVEITDNLGVIISNLSNTVTNFGKALVKGAFVTAISLPEAIIFTIITILATYFMAKDRHRIASVIRHHLPATWVNRILTLKKDLFMAIFGYLRAALIMMVITFTELFIGLSIIQEKYALLLAFLIALIDALPVLGAGGVLIPWSIYSFIAGDIRMGVSVIILYFVVLVVRQIVEPKVVGQQIGVHPLLTLLAMYTGLRMIGFAGLILGPITFILIRNILVTIYRKKPVREIIGFDRDEADTGTADSGGSIPYNGASDYGGGESDAGPADNDSAEPAGGSPDNDHSGSAARPEPAKTAVDGTVTNESPSGSDADNQRA